MQLGQEVEVAVALLSQGVEWMPGRIVREHFDEKLGYRYDVQVPTRDCVFTHCSPTSIRVLATAIKQVNA